MFGLFRRRGAAPSRPIVDRVSDLLDRPPSTDLVAAITAIADRLTDARLGPRLGSQRPQLVLAFARQSADAAKRMSSAHWTSDRGRNVGLDVLQANEQALGLFIQVLESRPPARRPLEAMIKALDALIERRRSEPGDDDGYGLATLHEIRRDLALLDRPRGRPDRRYE
jgi:hypothetical protein